MSESNATEKSGQKTAMKIGGFGCGCLGLLFMLSGIGAVVLVAAGEVNSSEEGTAIGIGAGLLFSGLLPLILGVVLIIFGFKKPKPSPPPS